MKNYQLINLLSQLPKKQEVVIRLSNCSYSSVLTVQQSEVDQEEDLIGGRKVIMIAPKDYRLKGGR